MCDKKHLVSSWLNLVHFLTSMSKEGQVNGGGEATAAAVSAQGGGQPPTVVTPDMLYKLSKKIAQLTKVIYSLNTRNDDLEVDLETVRSNYEEKLQMKFEILKISFPSLLLQGGS